MALYAVVLPGDYKPGQIVEDLSDQPGFVQPVKLVNDPDQRRAIPGENYGVALPLTSVRKTLIKIQSSGIDRTALQERGYYGNA
jgi:hypothetical protein